ncbi:unnamed protein product [Acanthoscelides obtectus]|uniref:NADP-dependent oxidoreductase domain-containing protein n=2 Tax=Acanthoscelides obtectus TaxID=200917 RepID=A0A9P0KW37_ACAOB|nr:unnamed protein product [Acanthoscelides obtectus]CAK1625548.1 1,5-anhydro-D-fructose reductase [Acanthoscelides obtectus]
MSTIPTVLPLNSGHEIPVVGLGTYKSSSGEVGEAVKYAIQIGYRHIDCAWMYANEAEIGHVLKEILDEGSIKREDLFIVTKLWNNFHARELVVEKLKESLSLLNLTYIDLYLIHWPMGFKDPSAYTDIDYVETWKGMEECVDQGLAKSIGLSNFNEEQITRVLENCRIRPAVNQIEVNPNLNQKDLIGFCKEREIVVTGYCPLGRAAQSQVTPGYPVSTLLDQKVVEMGKKYGKTAAQVVLRYLISLGIAVIPKSVNENRIQENIQIFDFDLDPEDISYLDSRNTGQRIATLVAYKDHKYYPFR